MYVCMFVYTCMRASYAKPDAVKKTQHGQIHIFQDTYFEMSRADL